MIPDEAVEAAAMVWIDHRLKPGGWDLMESMRATIEAAAPHVLAGLLSDLTKLATEFDRAEGGTLAYTVSDGRFQMRKNAHDQLMYIVTDYDESAK